jgi:hypothetical protein
MANPNNRNHIPCLCNLCKTCNIAEIEAVYLNGKLQNMMLYYIISLSFEQTILYILHVTKSIEAILNTAVELSRFMIRKSVMINSTS